MEKTWNDEKQVYEVYCPLCAELVELPKEAVSASAADPAEWSANAIIDTLKEYGHDCQA